MADNEQKAMQLIAEAEKKLNTSKSFLGSLFGGGSRAEEAVDLYARAGNLLKMSKKWGAAGGAFAAAAGVHLRGGAKHDAATSYVDAANCYKKVDAGEAVACLLKAIEIYTDMGRFTVAAKQHQVIAELYETELGDATRAMQHYEQAADYFRGEESTAAANKCLLKMAQYAATLERYDAAINIYEQVATAALENSLLKYSAKEYLFRAALCHLCVDVLNAQLALDKYVNMYPAFADSREHKLLKELIEQLEESNAEGFTAAVAAYDSISRLDAWHTALLVKIKKQINDDPDLR